MIKSSVVKSKKGFTLIELLVVTAIIGILSVVSSQIVLSILESQDQTQVINEVRQNGDQVLNVFERDVRAARSIIPGGSAINLKNADSDGSDVYWACVATGIRRDFVMVTSTDPVTGVRMNSGPIPDVNTCLFEVSDPFNVTGAKQTVRWRFQLRPTRDDMQDVTVRFETTISTRR